MYNTKNSTKSGSALIMVILTITAIMIVVLSVSKLTKPYLTQAGNLNDAIVAQNAAETGTEMFSTFSILPPIISPDTVIDITLNQQVDSCASHPSHACIIYSTAPSGEKIVTGTYANISRSFISADGGLTWTTN